MLHGHGFLVRVFNFRRDRQDGLVHPEALHVRIEQHADPARPHGAIEGLAVVLEQTGEFSAAVGQHHPVLLAQGESGLDGTVAAADDEDVLVLVVARAVEAVIDVLLVLAVDAELAGIAALPGSQHDPTGAVGLLVRRRREQAVLLLHGRQWLLGAHVDLVVLDDLVPASDQVFLLRAIEPQLALGGHAVRLGIDPLALREVLDRVGDLRLFEEDAGKPPVAGGQSGVQPGSARAHNEHIEDMVVGFRDTSAWQRGDVLDDVVALLHGQLDHRRARQVADDEQPRDVALEVSRQLGSPAGAIRGGEEVACQPTLQGFDHLSTARDRRPARSTSESAVGVISALQSRQVVADGWLCPPH